jgi:hypothetical protein
MLFRVIYHARIDLAVALSIQNYDKCGISNQRLEDKLVKSQQNVHHLTGGKDSCGTRKLS